MRPLVPFRRLPCVAPDPDLAVSVTSAATVSDGRGCGRQLFELFESHVLPR